MASLALHRYHTHRLTLHQHHYGKDQSLGPNRVLLCPQSRRQGLCPTLSRPNLPRVTTKSTSTMTTETSERMIAITRGETEDSQMNTTTNGNRILALIATANPSVRQRTVALAGHGGVNGRTMEAPMQRNNHLLLSHLITRCWNQRDGTGADGPLVIMQRRLLRLLNRLIAELMSTSHRRNLSALSLKAVRRMPTE